MNIYLDATTLIALGEVGELDLLTSLDGRLRILPAVTEEVTTERAEHNLRRFMNRDTVSVSGFLDSLFRETREAKEEAKRVLAEDGMDGDVAIVTMLIQLGNKGIDSALVSDDRRLRTVAEGLGARVTGTIGVGVRAVAEDELTEQEAKTLVRRLDSHGLHMTGELRETTDELIEEAARKSEGDD